MTISDIRGRPKDATYLVGDLEADNLYDYKAGTGPTKIHCGVFYDPDSLEKFYFVPDEYIGHPELPETCRPNSEIPELLDRYDYVSIHNGIGYDTPLLFDVFGYKLPIEKTIDTLVASRLGNSAAYHSWHPRYRKAHSVEAWAKWLGLKVQKQAHEDWTKFSVDMFTRCDTDVQIQVEIFNHIFDKELNNTPFNEVVMFEMRFAEFLQRMKANGFHLNGSNAYKAYQKYRGEADVLQERIRKDFPEITTTKRKRLRITTDKKTGETKLHGQDKKWLENRGISVDEARQATIKDGDDFYYEYEITEAFNVDSPKQRVERLLEVGWVPLERTKAGKPKSPDAECLSLQNPELPESARLFSNYLLKRSREKTVHQWLEAADKNHYVHGSIMHIGAWTHRSAHRDPNLGNVPSRADDAPIMRGCWDVEDKENHVLLGVDASGIQSRALAHYIAAATGNSEYIDIVSNPDNDIHCYNAIKAGLMESIAPGVFEQFDTSMASSSGLISKLIEENDSELAKLAGKARKKSKTFFYAFVLGSGYYKTGVLVGADKSKYDELLQYVKDNNIRSALEYSMKFSNVPLKDENFAVAAQGFITKNSFIDNVPGLKEFIDKKTGYVGQLGRQGKVEYLDGRIVRVENAYNVMAALLQGFETIIMRRAMLATEYLANQRNLLFIPRNYVHDELQLETHKDHAEEVGDIFIDQLFKAGRRYGSLCPLTGEKLIGYSWDETH